MQNALLLAPERVDVEERRGRGRICRRCWRLMNAGEVAEPLRCAPLRVARRA